MVLGIPIIQLVLFGYAINTDPKQLPTAVVMADRSEFTRSYLAAMKTSGYFTLVERTAGRRRGKGGAGARRRAVRGHLPGRLHAAGSCAASARQC